MAETLTPRVSARSFAGSGPGTMPAELHAARDFRSVAHGFATLDLDESFDRLLHTFIAGLRDR